MVRAAFAIAAVHAGSGHESYRFNKHAIAHHFCPVRGVAPFADGEHQGHAMAGVNVRCLEGVDTAGLEIRQVDGRSL